MIKLFFLMVVVVTSTVEDVVGEHGYGGTECSYGFSRLSSQS
jgi:hypothetical protein